MQTLWTNADKLSSLNFYLSWIGVALIVLGAVVTSGSILIARQIEKLNKIEAQSKLKDAHQKITEQSEQIKQLYETTQNQQSQIRHLPTHIFGGF